jgi:hypothetical protein
VGDEPLGRADEQRAGRATMLQPGVPRPGSVDRTDILTAEFGLVSTYEISIRHAYEPSDPDS